jgi:outer membrane lipoprotein carrier protein
MTALRLVAGLLTVSAFGADPALSTMLKNVETRYNKAKTLQVLFKEEYTPPGRVKRTENGILMLRKPGKMRWDYTQPKGKLVVSDGKMLQIYSPAENRVERVKFQESEDLRAPLAFLLGKLDFDKEFRNLTTRQEGDSTRILAEPKGENLPYSAVEFLIATDYRIREVKATQFDHSSVVFSFDQERVDPPLDNKLFQFQPPKGAQVEGAQ